MGVGSADGSGRSKPGFGMTAGVAFAVLAGVFYGAYWWRSRWLAGIAAPTALMLSQTGWLGALVLAPFGTAGLAAGIGDLWAGGVKIGC